MGRSRETVREAAAFFIEQILFYPDADSYRVLGARPEATNGELRRNMALLLRWLHPDHDGQGARSVFARRVTRAWNDLKTQGAPRRLRSIEAHSAGSRNLSYAKRAAHTQRTGRSARRLHNSAPYRMQVPVRSFKIQPRQVGLLRRVLLLLLGRLVR